MWLPSVITFIGRLMLLVGPSLGAAVAIDFAVNHSEIVGHLHCLLPWWEDVTVTFMNSGGYNVSSQIKHVEGTPERPRLCVFRSNKHLYVQVIDDTKMHTLASASTMQKPISEEFNYSSGPTILWCQDVAKKVGEVIAKSCLDKGIIKVAFDRGGYLYHGRIEALADAAREHGLQF
ncbi:unnamed protein product [Camellia sinensis]